VGGNFSEGAPDAYGEAASDEAQALEERVKYLYYQKYKNDPKMLGTYTPIPASQIAAMDDDPEVAAQKYLEFVEQGRKEGYNPYDIMRQSHWTGEGLSSAARSGEKDWAAKLLASATSSGGTRGQGTYSSGFGDKALEEQFKSATPDQLAQMKATRQKMWGDYGDDGSAIDEMAKKYGNPTGKAYTGPAAGSGMKMPSKEELAWANKYGTMEGFADKKPPTGPSGRRV